MASLEQLKKKLRSVELTKQLTSAMKTVSSAKYSKINKVFSAYKEYAKELEKLASFCDFSDAVSTFKKDEKKCFVILGHNRGFCGAYNTELYSFANQVLENEEDYTLIVCGKNAITHFEGKKEKEFEQFILPDVPTFSLCKILLDKLIGLYFDGDVKSVSVIYQSFINTMHQEPVCVKVLPFETENKKDITDDVLLIPDGKTISSDLERKIIESKIYKMILEAAIGAQSATLLAMRTAVDHATETAEILENEIHKKRQSAVTSGVIETGSTAVSDEEA